MIDSGTLSIQGFTPYAQVPRWILRSGDRLSHTAVRLYGVIMTYADNSTRAAFPSREKLAQDVGASVATVKRAVKELEDQGAIIVTRRRNKKTGNFYANHYVLVFENPWVTDDPARKVMDDPISKLTNITTSTDFHVEDESSTVEKSFTPEQSSGTTPGSLLPKQRYELRARIRQIGKLIQEGHKFYGDLVQDEWYDFSRLMEEAFKDDYHNTAMADLLDNGKWTLSAKVADPYEAGAELNKIIATSYTA